MKKSIIIVLLLFGFVSLVFASGMAESKLSVGAGYTGTTITDTFDEKATFKGFALSLNGYDKPSYYNDLVIFVNTAYSFNSKNNMAGIENVFSSSFGVNLLTGVGYEFTFDPVSLILGGGVHLSTLTASRNSYPYTNAYVFEMGLGASVDVQAKISELFFIDLSGDLSFGLLRVGNLGSYHIEDSKSLSNYNIKIGAGFRIK